MKTKGFKAIRWTGGQRMLPRLGLVANGHILYVPADLDEPTARDFIRQNKAEILKPAGEPKTAEQQKE